MASFNQCTFIGNCGRTPEMNVTSDGTPFTRFSLAVNEKTGKGPQKKESTMWLNIVCWRQLAEIVNQYVQSGSPLLVTGKLVLRNYNDKNGVERQAVEIVANDVRMLQSKPKGGKASTELGEPDLDSEEFP